MYINTIRINKLSIKRINIKKNIYLLKIVNNVNNN